MAERATLRLDGEASGRPDRIPSDAAIRERLRQKVRQQVMAAGLVPPLTLEELVRRAEQVLAEVGAPEAWRDWVTVLVGNAVWEGTVARVPYARRILLLPQCLRDRRQCPATLDRLGLLCEECGSCPTGHLQAEAESLGYLVLVAEGTTVVTKLLEAGQADAVVGVSCLDVLERSFPHAAAAALPAIAVPLLSAGCDRTEVDEEWLRQAIHLRADGEWRGRLDLDRLRDEVRSFFERSQLAGLLEQRGTVTEEIALDWMAADGKRWRPLLVAAAFRALMGPSVELGDVVRRLAVAVECFHKASLIHDDIEDEDISRYGRPTLHAAHGVPVALNVGDLLVGEGYRLIAECGAPAERVARMLCVASRGHRALCLGQGDELSWSSSPQPLDVDRVVEIFRGKTAPAFAVSLALGAVCAGADDEVCAVLETFSDALGVAYQIRDDIDDFTSGDGTSDLEAVRPSLPLALALESGGAEIANLVQAAAHGRLGSEGTERLHRAILDLQVDEQARQLLDRYRAEALRSLERLRHPELKILLHRVVHKVFANPVGGHGTERAAIDSRTAAGADRLPRAAAAGEP